MMKRIVLIGLLAATLLFAQRGGKGGGKNGGPNIPQGSFTQGRLDRIATMLNLDKDQKKNLKTTFDEAQKEASALHDPMAKARLAVGEAVTANKSPDDIANACKAAAQLDTQMTEIEMKAFSTVFNGLDDSQKKGAPQLFLMMRGMFANKNWNDAQ